MSRTRVGGLTRAERLDWLRLIRTEQVGPITFFDLLDRYGNAAAALEAIPELAKRGGRSRPLTPPSRSAAEAELRRITAAGARLVALGEPGYPPPLARIPDPPPLLQIRGHDAVATAPAVALVGARSAALPAMRLAGRIAADLAAAGVVVVSGLARGIDAAAHDGALRAGPGGAGTMAVVAGGIDVVYPPEHAALQARIAAEGLLVAEQPPGTEPQARHFPRRNRIVAGATLATVVVEAAPRSGSLITARLAGDYGREVLAVPGSPADPRSEGANRLIRDGATLVRDAADVLEAIRPLIDRPLAEPVMETAVAPPPMAPDPAELDHARREIPRRIGASAARLDDLVHESGLTAATILTILLELELAGRLDRLPGQKVSLSMG
ncbi:DNA-processing protein DprA [Tistrella sp.]|jgi:DNA processing protein|uniref:DNA-processing protein DprA n=1 Tax=Tistrella sp. TaxID=2024861 RepID=UPI000C898B49|nr:DNA-processing protein DprA [Tistrella sp.]MAD37677.1 DNA-protecting protein DprA [Tistrella sp.]